jgi:hypothetical protein
MPGEMPKIVKFKMPKIVESLRSINYLKAKIAFYKSEFKKKKADLLLFRHLRHFQF